VRGGHKVLMEVDDPKALIVVDSCEILGQQLLPRPIHLLNIMIYLLNYIIKLTTILVKGGSRNHPQFTYGANTK
jgi:hypothetical protein